MMVSCMMLKCHTLFMASVNVKKEKQLVCLNQTSCDQKRYCLNYRLGECKNRIGHL